MNKKLFDALQLAIQALNAVPNFDTKLPTDRQYNQLIGRGMMSYELLRDLDKIIKEARTHSGFHPLGYYPVIEIPCWACQTFGTTDGDATGCAEG